MFLWSVWVAGMWQCEGVVSAVSATTLANLVAPQASHSSDELFQAARAGSYLSADVLDALRTPRKLTQPGCQATLFLVEPRGDSCGTHSCDVFLLGRANDSSPISYIGDVGLYDVLGLAPPQEGESCGPLVGVVRLFPADRDGANDESVPDYRPGWPEAWRNGYRYVMLKWTTTSPRKPRPNKCRPVRVTKPSSSRP